MVEHQAFQEVLTYLNSRIIGQEELNKRLIIALLTSGHLLVEGAPGLAKTTAIKTLASCIDCSYHRIQFTPDLLPADLTGTDIYIPEEHSFRFQEGPLFNNFLLGDEINRAPAKVQSALLEAMGEQQITIGKRSYQLPKLFLVMATQNPIESEGTYSLPEAQLDRFMLKIIIDYPTKQSEAKILALHQNMNSEDTITKPHLKQETIFTAQQQINHVHVSEIIIDYILELMKATRNPQQYSEDLAKWLSYGAGPRASIALVRAARANAWLDGRDYVTPYDIHSLIHEVLRHRLIMSYQAEAQGVTTDKIISTLLDIIPIP